MFKSYNIRIYGNDGKLISDLKTDNEKQFLVSSKVLTTKQDIVMAAFFMPRIESGKKLTGLLLCGLILQPARLFPIKAYR